MQVLKVCQYILPYNVLVNCEVVFSRHGTVFHNLTTVAVHSYDMGYAKPLGPPQQIDIMSRP